MMPLYDDNSLRKSTPIVTYVFIALNILIFLLELKLGEPFIEKWSFVPSRFLANPWADSPTIFTSMFMHGGWMHLFGNMLYLWIFGDNVEDNFGKVNYTIFYLLCGIIATFAQLLISTHSNIPHLGASGAIAGVLGAYILLYPRSKVNVLVGRAATAMPALIVIGFWFLLQFVSGVGSIAAAQGDEGGVAYMAHIGGFAIGFALAFLFRNANQAKIT